MSEQEPEYVSVTLTCHTEGCANADVGIDLLVPDTTAAAACGVCGEPITDTDPPLPVTEPPTVNPHE